MGRVNGKVAVISGAAQSLGKACALMLAKEGARVVVTDIQQAKGRETAEEINEAGGEAIFLKLDVAMESDWLHVIDTTLDKFGQLDILINNAGIALQANIEDTSLEDWKRLMQINLDGVFLGTKHAVTAMKKSGGGSIINLSSIEGIIGHPNLAAYNAAKGGVRLLTKSVALHCGMNKTGIRVNSIHPAFIWTPLVEEYLQAQPDYDEGLATLESLHPIGHLGEPDDIAYGALYLASDESKFVTGSELVIDGGYTAQ